MLTFKRMMIVALVVSALCICSARTQAAPTISSLSPTSGAVGASITITGTNFGSTQGTSTVKFNGTTATPTSWSATSIVAPVPTGATTGNVVVTVSGVASNGVAFTVLATPSITSLSPTSGAVAASITITGINLGATQGTSTVKFNGTTATPTSWSATSIVAPVPTGATTGNVVVHASGVDTAGKPFTVLATPTISSLSPTSGAIGASITITGTNFGSTQGTSTVKFNGTAATPTSWSATSIVAPVPTGTTTGNVVVHASGVDTAGKPFTVSATPTITSLSPTSAAVGTSVTITGTNFGSTQGTSTVKFNGTTATPTSWSATSIVAPVPTGATTGNVVVHASGVDTAGQAFTVLATPTITSLSPASGAVGASVTVTGTNFGSTQGTSTVKFNGTTATPTSWSATSIVVPVPTGATTGNVVVTVSGVASSGAAFTVLAAPSITSLSPTSGAVATSVTITGTNFGATQGSSTVTFNGTAATPTSWSATSIVAPVPTGATTGNVVVNAAGVASNGVNFTLSTLPSGWTDGDIGTVGLSGSASYASGVFTVNGAGAGVANSADAFNFAYRTLSGDGTIVARIVTVAQGTYPRAGVMIRETLDPGSTNVYVGKYEQYSQFYGFSYERSTTGAGEQSFGGFATPLPCWVKVVRSGSLFSFYASTDGVNWTQQGSTQTITMASSVFVGLGVTSADTTTLGSATFDNVSFSSAAAPAPVITSVSATTGPVGTQVLIYGSGFGATQGTSAVLLNGTPVTINSWSATSVTVTIPTGATSGALVVSVAPSMDDSNPVYFTLTSNPLPAGWLDQDVGAVGLAGNASYANGVFTVNGAGAGIGNTADGFHFVYQSLSGDGTFVARVLGEQGTHPQSGLMIRETLDTAATHMFIGEYLQGTNSNIFLFDRLTTGADDQEVGGLTAAPPYWLKLVRSGITFSGYTSADGTNWTQVGLTQPISMAATLYVGLGVSSADPTTLATGTFDSVSLTSSSAAPVISSLSATTGSVGSQVVISGSGFGSTQGSSAALLNDQPMTVNSWSATAITITIAAGASSGPLVVDVGPGMNASNPVTFTITSSPLPGGWLDQDIGTVGVAGNATYTGGAFIVKGAGYGIGNAADGLHFVYRPLTSNGTIIARVVTQDVSSTAGVMVRSTFDPGSTEVFPYFLNFGNGSDVTYMAYRTVIGQVPTAVGGGYAGFPYWIKVVRSADTFTCYVSPDGGNWTPVGTTLTFSTPQTVYVGLGVSSGSLTALAGATFDTVSITAGSSLPNPVVTGVAPTAGAPGTTVTITGQGFGATQSSSSVLFNGSTAAISSWSDTQIVAVVPLGASTGPVAVQVANITGQGPTFTVSLTVQVADSLGNQSSYTSQPSGGQWYLTAAQGSGCSSCTSRGTLSRQFDINGNMLWSSDALGNTTTYQYDSQNNLSSVAVPLAAYTTATTSYGYNTFGEVTYVTDAAGNRTTNSYDAKGNLISVTSATSSLTQFGYDAKGEVTSITDPLNNVTTLTYTTAGLIATITDAQSNVTSYQYDAHGNRTSITDALNQVTTFAYDTGDRLKTITYPGGATTTFAYDYRGRRTSVTDQNNKTTTYAYDDADRLTSVTDAANHVTTYAYDTENNLTGITDANGHATTFAYDAYGRVTQTSFPSSQTETYAYDADNNLTSKIDRKGQTITYVYDALNRLTRKRYLDGTEVDYVYDLVGKVLSVNDPTGTYAFAYDGAGRLIGTTTSYSFLSIRNFTNSYGYDAASNRTSFTDPENGATSYAYDTLNRLTTLTPPSAFSGTGAFGFGYDALSRRTSLSRPNAVNTTYSYDPLSRLLGAVHKLGATTLDGANYTVDNAGNRLSKADSHAGVTSNYTYDAIYELTQTTQGVNTTESYSYDPVGNRLTSLGVASYSNNTSNELTAKTGTSYTYDSNGNMITKTDSTGTTNYTWDYENRLISVTLPGSGGTVTFKYDPFGRRIYKSSSSGSVFAYDGDSLIEETNSSGAVVARYSQGLNIDEPLAMLRSAATSYYHADGLGSVTSLSNAAGTLAQTYTFDSFGKLTASSGSLTNPFQYAGREFDTESNLYFYRARYYDPTAGRFLSEDGLRFASGDVNFYTYVGNHPTDAADPLGYCKVIVRFTRALGFLPAYHAYIVTIDPSGQMMGFRGGPGQTGNLHTDAQPYDKYFPDFEPGNPEKGTCKKVLDDNKPCRQINLLLSQALDSVEAANTPYRFESSNSNSLIPYALNSAGLPVPTPPVWAPGWGSNPFLDPLQGNKFGTNPSGFGGLPH